MINLNKESIRKIKDIDNKADKIIATAEKNSEEIIFKVKHELPSSVKEAQTRRDLKKTKIIEESRKDIEEETKEKIFNELSKIRKDTVKIDKNIDSAADIALEIFIKKIEQKK